MANHVYLQGNSVTKGRDPLPEEHTMVMEGMFQSSVALPNPIDDDFDMDPSSDEDDFI